MDLDPVGDQSDEWLTEFCERVDAADRCVASGLTLSRRIFFSGVFAQ